MTYDRDVPPSGDGKATEVTEGRLAGVRDVSERARARFPSSLSFSRSQGLVCGRQKQWPCIEPN